MIVREAVIADEESTRPSRVGAPGCGKPGDRAACRLLPLCGDPDYLDPGAPPVRRRARGLPGARWRSRARDPDLAGRAAPGSGAPVRRRGRGAGGRRAAQPGPALVVPAALADAARRPGGG